MSDVLTLAQELAEVTRLVEDDDLASAFERFTTRTVATVPGCVHASITVRTPQGAVETIGDSQLDLGLLTSGPIIEAVTFREPRRLADVAADQRWPAFSAELAAHGLRGCLSLPAVTDGAAAVLTLFSDEPDQFGDSSYDLVMLLTLHAGTVFDNVSLYQDSGRLVAQLRAALETRALVGRAQGLMMHRFGLDTEGAFDALRTASQHSNRKLRDVARELVEAHDRGVLEDSLRGLSLPAAHLA